MLINIEPSLLNEDKFKEYLIFKKEIHNILKINNHIKQINITSSVIGDYKKNQKMLNISTDSYFLSIFYYDDENIFKLIKINMDLMNEQFYKFEDFINLLYKWNYIITSSKDILINYNIISKDLDLEMNDIKIINPYFINNE